MELIERIIVEQVMESLAGNYVTALLGPRQCGKSTLARQIIQRVPDAVFLDLELETDLAKIENAELYFSSQRGKLICLDEIQRKPEIFPLMRALVDAWDYNGAFLVLGSASRDLLRQSSETLAGRISYHTLTPFLWDEVASLTTIDEYQSRGGFPKSFLASTQQASLNWRRNFITTFLERDMLQWAGFSPTTMHRLWQMLAHNNGQTVNLSRFAKSLGVSDTTVRSYIDLLAGTFMVEVLPPYLPNLGKRLVKSPKVYVADSGITTALLGLRSFDDIAGHSVMGSLWEQMVLTNLKGHFEEAEQFFYRTSAGAEIDIVMKLYNKTFAIECKVSLSPTLSRGNHNAIADIAPDHTFVVIPTTEGWPIDRGIDAVSLGELPRRINEALR